MNGFIYNVTTKVSPQVHEQWLTWMQEEHIPKMIGTACFSRAVILRLKEVDETDGPTYAVQYYADNEQQYEQYLERFAKELRKDSHDKWSNQIVSFRTIMEVVN